MKLSELKDDEVLLVNEKVMTKEDLLKELNTFKKKPLVYTTIPYEANLNAQHIIYDALENEATSNMHDGWYDDVMLDVLKEDIDEIQTVLNRILSRHKEYNVSYSVDKEVEIDVEEKKKDE